MAHFYEFKLDKPYEIFDRSATTHHEVYVSHFFFCAVASKAVVIKRNNTTKTKDFMEAFVHYASFLSRVIVRQSMKQNSSTEPEF